MQEPHEALVRDDAGEGAGHVRLMMAVIGRVAVRRDKTSRVVASPRHPQQGELNASHKADDESKAQADEPPLLVELAIRIIQINLHTGQLRGRDFPTFLKRNELVLNVTHLGEEGTRDTLRVGHSGASGTPDNRLIYTITPNQMQFEHRLLSQRDQDSRSRHSVLMLRLLRLARVPGAAAVRQDAVDRALRPGQEVLRSLLRHVLIPRDVGIPPAVLAAQLARRVLLLAHGHRPAHHDEDDAKRHQRRDEHAEHEPHLLLQLVQLGIQLGMHVNIDGSQLGHEGLLPTLDRNETILHTSKLGEDLCRVVMRDVDELGLDLFKDRVGKDIVTHGAILG
jgi:hypothetical protein